MSGARLGVVADCAADGLALSARGYKICRHDDCLLVVSVQAYATGWLLEIKRYRVAPERLVSWNAVGVLPFIGSGEIDYCLAQGIARERSSV